MNRLRPAFLALLLAACTATPAVDLHQLDPALAARGAIAFRLTDSVIAIGVAAADDKGLAPPVSLADVEVVCEWSDKPRACDHWVRPYAAPVDFTASTYAIEPRARRFVETRLVATYLPDSLRLAELSVLVKDHRVEVINAIGTLAAAAGAKLAGGAADQSSSAAPYEPPPKLLLPVLIDLADAKAPADGATCRPAADAGAGPCHRLPGNPRWSYRLTMTDDPGAQGFVPRARLPGLRDVMVSSICRPARLTIDATRSNGAIVPILELRVTVADPDWLSTTRLPAKGQLVFQPLCGINVRREEVTEIGADAMAAALANQINALRAATR